MFTPIQLVNYVVNLFLLVFVQVCIGFLLQCGRVVLPKSTKPARISENFKSTELQLDAEDMRRLRELEERNFRMIKGKIFLKKGEAWEDLWDFDEDEKFTVKPPQPKKQKTKTFFEHR